MRSTDAAPEVTREGIPFSGPRLGVIASAALGLALLSGCECDPRVALCSAVTRAGDEVIEASPPRGFHSGPIEVTLRALDDARELRFTLDGRVPDESSARYEGPIRIETTSTLRVVAVPRQAGDAITTHTYVIGQDAPLPVIALTADPHALFDARQGVYANPEAKGQEWERPASFELLDPSGARTQREVLIRIHGGWSRGHSEKKSLRLYFRPETGGPLELASFFGHDRPWASSLILRAGFNDSWASPDAEQRPHATMVRDAVARQIYRNLGHPSARGRFVMLYLSGQPWGVYELCERYEEEWLEQQLGHQESGWDLIKGKRGDTVEAASGDLAAFDELISFARDERFVDPQQVEEIAERLDLDSFTDYVILNLWLSNYDWPQHNWYAARPRVPGAKWTFLMWDAEYGFGVGNGGYRVDHNTLRHLRDVQQGPVSRLVHTLWKHDVYRNRLIARMEELLGNELSPEQIESTYLQISDVVEPAVPFEASIWGLEGPGGVLDLDDWQTARDLHLYDYTPQRAAHLRAIIYQAAPQAQ